MRKQKRTLEGKIRKLEQEIEELEDEGVQVEVTYSWAGMYRTTVVVSTEASKLPAAELRKHIAEFCVTDLTGEWTNYAEDLAALETVKVKSVKALT